MKRPDLNIGDRVWVYLPYEGGKGSAIITDFAHDGAVVRFEPGYRHIHRWENRKVSLRSIIRPDPDTEGATP